MTDTAAKYEVAQYPKIFCIVVVNVCANLVLLSQSAQHWSDELVLNRISPPILPTDRHCARYNFLYFVNAIRVNGTCTKMPILAGFILIKLTPWQNALMYQTNHHGNVAGIARVM